MEIWIAKVDETDTWTDERLKRIAGKIFTVYLYNPKVHVHLCEITPSHELTFVGFVMQGSQEFMTLDESAREEVYEELQRGLLTMVGHDVAYMWVSSIERMPVLEHDYDLAHGRARLGDFKVDDESDNPREWTEEQTAEAIETARESIVGNGYVDT